MPDKDTPEADPEEPTLLHLQWRTHTHQDGTGLHRHKPNGDVEVPVLEKVHPRDLAAPDQILVFFLGVGLEILTIDSVRWDPFSREWLLQVVESPDRPIHERAGERVLRVVQPRSTTFTLPLEPATPGAGRLASSSGDVFDRGRERAEEREAKAASEGNYRQQLEAACATIASEKAAEVRTQLRAVYDRLINDKHPTSCTMLHIGYKPWTGGLFSRQKAVQPFVKSSVKGWMIYHNPLREEFSGSGPDDQLYRPATTAHYDFGLVLADNGQIHAFAMSGRIGQGNAVTIEVAEPYGIGRDLDGEDWLQDLRSARDELIREKLVSGLNPRNWSPFLVALSNYGLNEPTGNDPERQIYFDAATRYELCEAIEDSLTNFVADTFYGQQS